eukprot:1920589-Amphidinium_carterae.1
MSSTAKGDGKSSGKGDGKTKMQHQWVCLCGARNPHARSECRRCGVIPGTPQASAPPRGVAGGGKPPTTAGTPSAPSHTKFEHMRAAQQRISEINAALGVLSDAHHGAVCGKLKQELAELAQVATDVRPLPIRLASAQAWQQKQKTGRTTTTA